MATGLQSPYIKSGVTANTPGNFTFGAGVLLKDLNWDNNRMVLTTDPEPVSGKTYYRLSGSGIFTEETNVTSFSTNPYGFYEKSPGFNYALAEKLGATKDGTTLKIAPEYTDIDIDGVLVKMKGMTVKTGEIATIETTFTENTAENAALALNTDIFNYSSIFPLMSGDYKAVRSRSSIKVNDYITNLAFVGNRIDDGSNREMVVIFKNALCTSGFEIATKNKDISTYKMTFECCADLASSVPVNLPFEIIYL